MNCTEKYMKATKSLGNSFTETHPDNSLDNWNVWVVLVIRVYWLLKVIFWIFLRFDITDVQLETEYVKNFQMSQKSWAEKFDLKW